MRNQQASSSAQSPSRNRVASQLKQNLAEIIQQLQDPKLGLVSISGLELSRDLRHAKVYVSVVGCDCEKDAMPSLRVLIRATGFVQHALQFRSRMRFIPEIKFLFDTTVERTTRLESLLRNERTRHQPS